MTPYNLQTATVRRSLEVIKYRLTADFAPLDVTVNDCQALATRKSFAVFLFPIILRIYMLFTSIISIAGVFCN